MEVAGNNRKSASEFDDEHPSSSSSSCSVSGPMNKSSTSCRCKCTAEVAASKNDEFAESYSSSEAKSERIAMLKSRFVDTISRSQQTLLLADQKKIKKQNQEPHETQMINCDNINYLDFKKAGHHHHHQAANKKKNKKNRCEYLEIKRINQQQCRQKRREAARKAINAIQKAVELNDGVCVMNEFQKLIGSPPHVPRYLNGYVMVDVVS